MHRPSSISTCLARGDLSAAFKQLCYVWPFQVPAKFHLTSVCQKRYLLCFSWRAFRRERGHQLSATVIEGVTHTRVRWNPLRHQQLEPVPEAVRSLLQRKCWTTARRIAGSTADSSRKSPSVNYGHHCRSTAKAGKTKLEESRIGVQHRLPLCIRAAAAAAHTRDSSAEHQQKLHTAWTAREHIQHLIRSMNTDTKPLS
jgi:hypothetical protein